MITHFNSFLFINFKQINLLIFYIYHLTHLLYYSNYLSLITDYIFKCEINLQIVYLCHFHFLIKFHSLSYFQVTGFINFINNIYFRFIC